MANPQGGAPGRGSVLPDVLEPGLKAVFCGSAAGTKSARVGQYYTGPGNQFWPTLHAVGLTPRRLKPREFQTLPEHGLGLTDLCKVASGPDSSLPPGSDDTLGLMTAIKRYAPRVLAFNGKRAAQSVAKNPEIRWEIKKVDYGPLQRKIGASEVWVLPSTSGAAQRYWDEGVWQELAAFIKMFA